MKETFIKPLVATLAAGLAAIIIDELKQVIAAKKNKASEQQEQTKGIPGKKNKLMN